VADPMPLQLGNSPTLILPMKTFLQTHPPITKAVRFFHTCTTCFNPELGATGALLLPIYIAEPTRGRCYDHNFLRFLTIFGEKIGVFLKNQCYDHNFCKNWQ
jgi:hypothetical protein